MISRGNYLSHYAKGQQLRGAKYKSRKLGPNGQWIYEYDDETGRRDWKQNFQTDISEREHSSRSRKSRNKSLMNNYNGVSSYATNHKKEQNPLQRAATSAQLAANQKVREMSEHRSLYKYNKQKAENQKRYELVSQFKKDHANPIPTKSNIQTARNNTVYSKTAEKAKASVNYQPVRDYAKSKVEEWRKNSTNTAILKTAVKMLATDTINKGKSILKKLFG